MKNRRFLFLLFLFAVMSCGKDSDNVMEEDPIMTSYSATFRTIVCDQEIDIDCNAEDSKIAAPSVQIFLFESVQARDLGQQIVTEGVTDINGYIGFTGLEAKDYFYLAIHPDPTVVEAALIQHHIRISPNTPSLVEEVVFSN
ncbi:MAG: hypothetical protein NXI23_09800 [Bacteroidetes bacterium]|jgi:hypothetical protein|nr:hypothetical protein [Bacteroidota bacterium]MDF1863541.1 hypothetical protein [Saprospiraceae bacterium]